MATSRGPGLEVALTLSGVRGRKATGLVTERSRERERESVCGGRVSAGPWCVCGGGSQLVPGHCADSVGPAPFLGAGRLQPARRVTVPSAWPSRAGECSGLKHPARLAATCGGRGGARGCEGPGALPHSLMLVPGLPGIKSFMQCLEAGSP